MRPAGAETPAGRGGRGHGTPGGAASIARSWWWDRPWRLSEGRSSRRQLDGLAERLRQLLDPQPLPLVGRQVVEVLLHRLRQLVTLLDSLEAGHEQRREGQVR